MVGKSEAKIRSIVYNWVNRKYTHKTVSEHSNMHQCCKQIPLRAVHSWDEGRTEMQSKGIQIRIDLCELGAIAIPGITFNFIPFRWEKFPPEDMQLP